MCWDEKVFVCWDEKVFVFWDVKLFVYWDVKVFVCWEGAFDGKRGNILPQSQPLRTGFTLWEVSQVVLTFRWKWKPTISQMIDTDRVGWSFLFPAISPFLHQTQQNDLISPTTLNIFYASFISFLRRFMNMRLWHFPRPNHSFANLLKYFTSKLKNEEFISINKIGLCSINSATSMTMERVG